MTPHTADGSGGNHTISESEIIDGAFLAALGLRLTEISGTRVRGEIELGPDHHTPWGSCTAGSTPPRWKASPVSERRQRYSTGARSPWAWPTTPTSCDR
mgnify:CR=1 FL=1